MRLAFLTQGAQRPDTKSLAYSWITSRAKGYQQKAHQVCVVAPLMKDIPEEYTLQGIPFHRAHPQKAFRIIADFSPDVVLIHHASPWTMKVPLPSSFARIFWIYGPEVTAPSDYYYEPGRFTRFFLNILDRRVNRKWRRHFSGARRFVCTSHYAAAQLSYLLPDVAVEVVYNPVEIPSPVSPRTEKEDAPKGLALEPLEHRTLVASGLDLLIRVFAEVKGTSLTLAGNGQAVSDLAKWISRERSAIELRAKSLTPEDLNRLFDEHDYLVITSRIERQVFRACQAMARGLPVLAPRRWAFPEVVADGENGVLFDPEDLPSLAEGLQTIVSAYQKMGTAALDWVRENCAMDTVIQKELQLIEAV